MGFRYLETDLHVTADGVLVAFHDERLDRVTNRRGRIAELPWDAVAGAVVEGSESVLAFADLLERFPDARINLDPKDDAVVAHLAKILLSADAVNRVCVSSFRRRRARRVKRLVEQASTMPLCTGAGPLGTFLLVCGVPFHRPFRHLDVVQVPARWGPIPVVTRRFVRRAHRRGLHVHVWTVDQPDEIRRLFDLGVDGVMSDDLEALAGVLAERGAGLQPPECG